MPALAPITINDGAATPVAHTFSPMSLDQVRQIANYADRSGGIPIGYPQVRVQLTPPAPGGKSSTEDRLYRAKFWVQLPVLEALSVADTGFTPAPTVAYTLRFNGEFILPERATLQNRKDILAYAKNYLALALTTSVVQDLESVY